MMNKVRNILVTTALPYGNGAIHLGHLVEAIQADIWVRWQRLSGNQCVFLSGTDAHGTSVMISAEKLGITPTALIEEMNEAHQRDFKNFLVDFDYFYTTHSTENAELLDFFYAQLQKNQDIFSKIIAQAYDPEKKIFLSDRFILGDCPRCGASKQYGDSCEVCGSTYDPLELKNPVSALSGATPIIKESLHYFFNLEKYHHFLQRWVEEGHLQSSITHKMQEWLHDALKPWDISRDAPYFGFEIPDAPGKYFYVWLEAPLGYLACLKKLCKQQKNIDFDAYWQANSPAEVYHFIGKDIVYFHALFWPALLKSAGFRLPTSIFTHGFLTVNGQKMSKSRGTFIMAEDYSKQLPAEYLRYYYAAKLTPLVEDIDLNFKDFCARVNADLVGKFVNLASRCAGFIHQYGQGRLADVLPDADLFQEFVAAKNNIAEHYENRHFSRVVREIMTLADKANQYIDQQKPWQMIKEGLLPDALQTCSQGINFFKLLATYLLPILPETAAKIAAFLKIERLSWQDIEKPLLGHTIAPFQPLMQRVKPEDIKL